MVLEEESYRCWKGEAENDHENCDKMACSVKIDKLHICTFMDSHLHHSNKAHIKPITKLLI